MQDITAAVDEEFATANIEQPPKDWDLGVAKDRIVEKEGMEVRSTFNSGLYK